jgi:protein TonB
MLVVVAAVLVLAAPAIILWMARAAARRSDSRHAGAGPIITLERKAPDQRPGNPEVKVVSQPGMPADSVMRTPSAKTLTKEELKPESVTPKPLSKAPPTKQANGPMDEVSRRLVATSRNSITVMKEEAPSSSTAEMAPSISNMLPNGVLGNLPSVLRDVPVARPTIASEGRLRVSSGVAQGLLVRQVAPRYPQQAVQAHVEGTVVLQAVIGKDGRVQNVHALSGNPMLIPAAIDAVSRWRYKPYQLNGEPVEADTQINVKFMLSGQ